MRSHSDTESLARPFWGTVALIAVLALLHLVERAIVPWARSRDWFGESAEESRLPAAVTQSDTPAKPADSAGEAATKPVVPAEPPPPKESLPDPPEEIVAVGDEEQLLVYLINHARHDPAAYQAAQDLPPEVALIPPSPPLAVQPQLFSSARFHAREMAEHNYFEHRSTKTGDWPNKMVRDTGYRLPDYFPADTNNVESIAAGIPAPARALKMLIHDQGVDPPSHRSHLLAMQDFHRQCREIGVGFATNPATKYGSYWAIHATWSERPTVYVTGVTYEDRNHNGRYDRGEGIPGAVVRAGRAVTRCNSAGGYALAVEAGQHEVWVDDMDWPSSARTRVTVERRNVHVEFIRGENRGRLSFAAPRDSEPEMSSRAQPRRG
ncbi:MAG: CAP domain-containing protein [Pirellulales bacterium]